MKLLSRAEAQATKKQENEALIASNIRLREYWKDIMGKLNTLKDDYEPEKVAELRKFEIFVQEIQGKKSKLLEKLAMIQREIEKSKEIYYGYIAKKDELAEMEYRIREENKKLDLREIFITDLEKKWQSKQ